MKDRPPGFLSHYLPSRHRNRSRGSKNGNNLLIQLIQKTSGVDFGRPYRLGYTGLDDGLRSDWTHSFDRAAPHAA